MSTASWVRPSHRRVVVLAALLALAACRREQYLATIDDGDVVDVVRVVRGHELVVRKAGALARIRLVGIYSFDPRAREKDEITAYGRAANDGLRARAAASPVRVVLERKAPDVRGRFLGFVYAGELDLGRALLEDGLAAVYPEFPFSREAEYFAAEIGARRQARGLWGGAAATRRMTAKRETWAAVRAREYHERVRDPLFAGAGR